MKNTRGITLVALVITIIILLILAGITISLVIGDNGLLSKTKYAGEEYTKSAIKEKIELAIVDIKLEEVQNTLTMDKIVEKLASKVNGLTIQKDGLEAIGTCDGYHYYITTDFEVIIGNRMDDKTSQITVTAKDIGKGIWEIEAINKEKEIKTIQYKLKQDNIYKQETGNKVKVDQNGTYQVRAIYTDNSRSQVEEVVIDKIPNFNIVLKYSTNKFTTDPVTVIPSTDGTSEIIKYAKGIHDKEYFLDNGEIFTGTNIITETQNNTVYTVYAKNDIGMERIKLARINNIMPVLTEKGVLSTEKGIVEYVKENNIEDGKYDLIIKDETYKIEIYTYNEDVVYDRDLLLGDSIEDERTLILKYNKDLTIENGIITAQVRKKGMYLCVNGTLINNGEISMTARGAKAEGQNVYLVKKQDGNYDYIAKDGGAGADKVNAKTSPGKGAYVAGIKGNAGSDRQTGGGGSGGATASDGGHSTYSGAGTIGTSYSGGTGGGGIDVNMNGGVTYAKDGETKGGSGGNGYGQRGRK